MTSAYFASFVLLPVVITEPGEYVTRCGEIVVIQAASAKHDFGCRGAYPNGTPERWHKSGRIYESRTTANDIVQKRV